MRTITTSTGALIALDGDLLAIMETLYREVTARRDLERSFEDPARRRTAWIVNRARSWLTGSKR